MPLLATDLRSRGRLLGACFALAWVCHAIRGGSPSSGEEGLRLALGEAADGSVLEFVWEPRRSVLSEWFWGRPVLFLVQRDNAPRELFRGFVRMSPEGSPLGIARVRNLSQTDLADEDHLTADPRLAAVRSRDPAGQATVSLLDLHGAPRSAGQGLLGSLQLAIDRWISFGDLDGLGRADVLVLEPEAPLRLQHTAGEVVFSGNSRRTAVPLAQLLSGPEDVDLGEELLLQKRLPEPQPLLHWAADVGRSFAGAPAVAWLEERVFSARDWLVRAQYAAVHSPAAPPPLSPPRAAAPSSKISPAEAAAAPFPPARLPSPWPKPEPGEGSWLPAGERLTARPGEPPLFYRTFVRPDPDRPYAKHLLLVMDMTRLELGLRAGYEDPRPRTGPPGSGHIPKDEATFSRIVATFNGAFKVTHGGYGMKAEGRVLIPPVEGAATVRIDRDGRVGLGVARSSPSSTAELLGDAVAYRQNLDPLISQGQLLPTGRKDWGDHLVGSTIAAERSALCVTRTGHLIYAWSEEATAQSLARGLELAGCTAAIHLDMNPGHCAFAFNQVQSFQPLVAQGEALSPAMRINPNRFLRWSPKDFFYVARRSPLPQGAAAQGLAWQPAVASLKGGLAAITLGRKALAELTIEVDRVDLSRVQLSILAEESDAPTRTVEPPVGSFAWALGYATPGSRTGLSVDQQLLQPMNRNYAALILRDSALPEVRLPGAPVEPSAGSHVVQLPLLARDGRMTEGAKRLTGRRLHGALCVDDTGHLLLGRLQHDTPAPLVLTLLDLGCRTILETDRGSHSPALALRPEQEPEYPLGEAGTLLVAKLHPAAPRGYEF